VIDNGEAYNGLEILIFGPAAEEINVWRKRYDPTCLEVAPHITLAYPPFVPFDQWEIAKPALVACLAEIKPFRIWIKEASFFRKDSPETTNVLWLKPEDNGIIKQIRLILEGQLPLYVPPMSVEYIPHLSIGFIEGEVALQQALAEVNAEIKPFDFQVTEVVYEAQDKARGIQFFDRLLLGNDSFT
jgi:2'-5' RNA ligase